MIGDGAKQIMSWSDKHGRTSRFGQSMFDQKAKRLTPKE